MRHVPVGGVLDGVGRVVVQVDAQQAVMVGRQIVRGDPQARMIRVEA
jgi:hypothetical protein